MPDTKPPVPSITEVRGAVSLLTAEMLASGSLQPGEAADLLQESHHDGTIFTLHVPAGMIPLGVGRRAALEAVTRLRDEVAATGTTFAARVDSSSIGDEPALVLTANDLVEMENANGEVAEVMAAWEEARTLLEISVPKAEVLDKIVLILADRTKEWDLLTLAAIGTVVIEGGFGHASNGWFVAGPS